MKIKSVWCIWEEKSGTKMRHMWVHCNSKKREVHDALVARGAKNVRFEGMDENEYAKHGQALYVTVVDYTYAEYESSPMLSNLQYGLKPDGTRIQHEPLVF